MTCQEANCAIFNVIPEHIVMKYRYQQDNAVYAQVTVVNKTNKAQTFSVGLPVTTYFSVEALPKKVLVRPSVCFNFLVCLAKIKEQRMYYDTLAVMCENGCINEVRLEAIPLHKFLDEIPMEVNFGHIPLGYLATRTITLTPVERKIKFLFVPLTNNPDFAVSPTKGVVFQKPVDINIFYKPTAYITFRTVVQVYLPQIMNTPMCFVVTAHTKPGYLRNRIVDEASKLKEVRPENVGNLEIISKHYTYLEVKRSDDELNELMKMKHRSNLMKFERDRRSEDELLGPLGKYLDEEEGIKRLKEMEFNKEVDEIRKENISTNTHFRTKLRPATADNIFDIDRILSWNDYKSALKPEIDWNTLEGPQYMRQRTFEFYDQRETLEFTDRFPNTWFIRYINTSKFIDAARRIILMNRLLKVLNIFKNVTKETIEMLEEQAKETEDFIGEEQEEIQDIQGK